MCSVELIWGGQKKAGQREGLLNRKNKRQREGHELCIEDKKRKRHNRDTLKHYEYSQSDISTRRRDNNNHPDFGALTMSLISFKSIILLNSHNKPIRIILLFPSCRRNGGTEKLSNFPKVIRLENSSTEIQTKVSLQSPGF